MTGGRVERGRLPTAVGSVAVAYRVADDARSRAGHLRRRAADTRKAVQEARRAVETSRDLMARRVLDDEIDEIDEIDETRRVMARAASRA